MFKKIYIASDHAGFNLKKVLIEFLSEIGYDVSDLGTDSTELVDYPDFAKKLGLMVQQNKDSKGILICGTGTGMCIAVNKIKGIRAVLCCNEYLAKMSREHNDANVLCLGERVIGQELAKAIVLSWLNAEFNDSERNQRRIDKIE